MSDELSKAAALLGARGGRKSQIEVAARAVVHAWRSEPGGKAFLRALEALEALLEKRTQ